MKSLLSMLLFFLCFTTFAQKNYFMLVGTYTSGTSLGVYVYGFNSSNGENRIIDSVKIANPSYLAISPNEKFVYAVSETADAKNNGGSVASFSFNNITGAINFINLQPSNGNNPCYVAADKSGHWVIAGNYSSGTLAVLPVLKNGFLEAPITSIKHAGQSINIDRQKSPHVHAVVLSPDNKFLFVPDLGIDKVMIYRFDKRSGGLTPATQPFVSTKPGSGPRHFIFHPFKKYAYLVEELTGSIAAYRYHAKKGELTLVQNIATVPADFTAFAGSADIHVSQDGKFLYASNRGESNTIAIFSINKNTGMLSLAGHQSTMGITPRNFNFDPSGNFLMVANQNSDNIVIFKINKATGLLTDTGKRIALSKPVCIKWIAQKY